MFLTVTKLNNIPQLLKINITGVSMIATETAISNTDQNVAISSIEETHIKQYNNVKISSEFDMIRQNNQQINFIKYRSKLM